MRKSARERRRRKAALGASRHPSQPLRRALASHQAGDLSTAVSLYQEVISADPQQAVALHHLGLIAHQQGRTDEAVGLLERALASDDGDVAGWTNLGNIYQESGCLMEAERAYRKAIQYAPDHVSALYNLGWVLKDSGDDKAAAECFRNLSRITPEDAEIWHGLGVVLEDINDRAGAEESFRKAIELEPSFVAAWYDLGNTLSRQGRLEEGLESLQAAVRHDPGFAEAHNNLGNLYLEKGRVREAVASFQRSAALRPDHIETLQNLASALVAAEDLEAATRTFEQAISINRDQFLSHLGLGEVWFAREEYAKAETSFRQAVKIKPTHAPAYSGLGKALLRLGRVQEAQAACRQAIELDGKLADAYANLGSALKLESRLSEAIEVFQTALELDPSQASVYNNLGLAYMDAGDFDKANDCYQKAIQIDPEFPEVLANLASSRRYTSEDQGAIAQLVSILERGNLRNESRVSVHFALGKIFDDCEHYDEAFDHYARGNELKAQKVRFDRLKHTQTLEMLRHTFTPELFSRFSGYGSASELPVFIVGMPRSGTTLVEQIVASHPSIFGADELTDIAEISKQMSVRLGSSTPYPEIVRELTAEVAAGSAEVYLSVLRDFSMDAMRITDKMPSNFLHLGVIALLFPNAKVIHCKRNARDVCLSNYFQLYTQGQHYSYRLSDLALYHREYVSLMSFWRRHLPIEMYDVVYEELVNDQEVQSRGIIDYLGVPWDERCLQFHTTRRAVQTASHWQVRQPISNRSAERWRHYQAFFGAFFEELEGGMHE